MVIPEPSRIQEILDQHMRKVQLHNTTSARLKQSRKEVLDLLTVAVTADNSDAILKTAELQNEIEEAELKIQLVIIPEYHCAIIVMIAFRYSGIINKSSQH